MPKSYPGIGLQVPEVLLPSSQIDPQKWAVIACDQFTSQPEYWEKVEAQVGNMPSTLSLILPEVYLDTPGCQERISRIHANMKTYLDQEIVQPFEGFIYVERTIGDSVRPGLIAALDLDQYDFRPGSQSMIRSTEGTILERIPARIQVRRGAVVEVPHTLVLIDDPFQTVIGPLSRAKNRMKHLYDFDLMMGSGHLSGWLVDQPDLELGVVQSLQALARPERFAGQDGGETRPDLMLYAVGDGNHSCAAAKVLWDELKTQPGISPQHPARYALVEIENLRDEALCFEPIHRVVFDLRVEPMSALHIFFGAGVGIRRLQGLNAIDEMVRAVDQGVDQGQVFGMLNAEDVNLVTIPDPKANLAVGSLQAFLDLLVSEKKADRIDYVHGAEVVFELGAQPGNLGFYLPPIDKADLFKTVILDGALPRKTFSMGAARDKRFYMESRKLIP